MMLEDNAKKPPDRSRRAVILAMVGIVVNGERVPALYISGRIIEDISV